MWEPEGRHTLASPPLARLSSDGPRVKLTCVIITDLGNYCRLTRNLVFPGKRTSSTTVGETAQSGHHLNDAFTVCRKAWASSSFSNI